MNDINTERTHAGLTAEEFAAAHAALRDGETSPQETTEVGSEAASVSYGDVFVTEDTADHVIN